MMRFIFFAAIAGAGYYFTHNWFVVGGVIVAYALYSVIISSISVARDRRRTDTLLHQKLSEAEKDHMSSVSEHQRAMHAHRAQFDPDLRKKM